MLYAEDLERVTLANFKKINYAKRVPVVITDVVPKWPACDSWSPEYFVKLFPKKTVEVAVTNEDSFAYENGRARYRNRCLSFQRAISGILNQHDDGTRYFLMQQAMESRFPELMKDIVIPGWLDKNQITINFWVGSAGAFTPLHFDTEDNFIAQVFGAKRFILYDPTQMELLYPNEKSDKYSHLSRVDITAPNDSRFPRFKDARPVELTLNAGEMLFLPSHWWHAVQSLSVNAMVNFWQLGNQLSLYLENPTGIRSLWYLYQDNLLQSLRVLLAKKQVTFVDCAEKVLPIQPSASVLYAHAAVIERILVLSSGHCEHEKSLSDLPELVATLFGERVLSESDINNIQDWRFLALQTFTEDLSSEQARAMISSVKKFLLTCQHTENLDE